MAYDEQLDSQIKGIVTEWPHTNNKKMFGGVCHLMNGNMFGGVYKHFLILRLGEEKAKKALQEPHVRVFDITGRPMKGWVMVDRDGFSGEGKLQEWLDQAREFVNTLPPK